MSISEHKHMPAPIRRIEVFTGAGRRRSWSPEEKASIVAESYGGGETVCAVARRHGLTPQQLFTWRRLARVEPTSDAPALVCPCHYSTFDVRRAAKVTLGPAGRPLPQLPLRIDERRRLVAGGPLSGSVGPAWWGTKRG